MGKLLLISYIYIIMVGFALLFHYDALTFITLDHNQFLFDCQV